MSVDEARPGVGCVLLLRCLFNAVTDHWVLIDPEELADIVLAIQFCYGSSDPEGVADISRVVGVKNERRPPEGSEAKKSPRSEATPPPETAE